MPHNKKSPLRDLRFGEIQRVLDALIKVGMALGRSEAFLDDADCLPEIRALFGRLSEEHYLDLTASYGRIDMDARYEKPKDKLDAQVARLARSRKGATFDRATRKYIRGSGVGAA